MFVVGKRAGLPISRLDSYLPKVLREQGEQEENSGNGHWSSERSEERSEPPQHSPDTYCPLSMYLLVASSSFTCVSLWSLKGDSELLKLIIQGERQTSKQMTTARCAQCTGWRLHRAVGAGEGGKGHFCRDGWGCDCWTKEMIYQLGLEDE